MQSFSWWCIFLFRNSFHFLFLILLFWVFLFRSAYFGKLSSTCSSMLGKPMISRLRRSIHRPFYITIKWWLVFTSSIASPYMLSIKIYFIMKAVANCNIQICCSVYLIHNLNESRSVATLCLACRWIRFEEISMDHLMQKSLFELVWTPKL